MQDIITGAGLINFNFSPDTWFELKVEFDLDLEITTVFFDDVSKYTIVGSSVATVGGISFQGGSGQLVPSKSKGYIDDVYITEELGIGIGELSSQDFNTYPNPVQDELNIELSNASAQAIISVIDIYGRTVIPNQQLNQTGHFAKAQLDLNHLHAGNYIVKIQDGNKSGVYHFVKQ